MNTKKKKIEIKSNSKNNLDLKEKEKVFSDIGDSIKKVNSDELKKNQTTNTFSFNSFVDKLSLDYPKELYKSYIKKKTYFMVIMHLRNGKYDMFTVSTSEQSFIRGKSTYFIDADFFKHNSFTGCPVLFYHEDVSAPFKIEFNIDKLFREVREHEPAVELALNPVSLKGFINSQVIEKVLKGQELTEDMAFMKKLIIIGLLVNGVVAIVILKQMGIF